MIGTEVRTTFRLSRLWWRSRQLKNSSLKQEIQSQDEKNVAMTKESKQNFCNFFQFLNVQPSKFLDILQQANILRTGVL